MAQDNAVHILNVLGTPTLFDIHGNSLGGVGEGGDVLANGSVPFTGAVTFEDGFELSWGGGVVAKAYDPDTVASDIVFYDGYGLIFVDTNEPGVDPQAELGVLANINISNELIQFIAEAPGSLGTEATPTLRFAPKYHDGVNVSEIDMEMFSEAPGGVGTVYFGKDGNDTFVWDENGNYRVAGTLGLAAHSAPADGAIATGALTFWFDQTNGAAKLMIKAKQADGAVKTAEIALS